MVIPPVEIETQAMSIPATLVLHDSLIMAWDRICIVHRVHDCLHAKKCLLIFGESGEGKTFLVTEYLNLYPTRETLEKIITPVLYYRFREAKKSIEDILKLLIKALGTTPPKGRTEPGELDEQFTCLVKSMGVELIFLDEIQQILPKSDCLTAFNTLKYFCALLDELNVSIVFVGSERAMKLLSFGQSEKVAEDNEQLSRRMLRPVRIEGIEPRTRQWVDCVNFFLSKINVCPLTTDDGDLLDRIYIAYTERSFSTLESLFLTEDMTNIKSKKQLQKKLKEKFQIYGKSNINPFDPNHLSLAEVDEAIEHHFEYSKY